MATMTSTRTAKKTAYKPRVEIVNAEAGLYQVQSETYKYVLYLVAVADDGTTTCECTAGAYGRSCKHQTVVQAYVAYRARPQHIRPAARTFAELAEEFAALEIPALDFRTKRPDLVARHGGAAGLLDAFGA